jgi:beta-glucosidase
MKFPSNFAWGTATSAYQIEGAVNEGGRKESIWDIFSHTAGRIENGDTGDVADDHYHRWKEDIKLMKDLGYKAYRFSLAWPRILPDGTGKVNPTGMTFYQHLIDELLAADIQPLVTLYHWDLPTAISGGWLDRTTVEAFAEYTDIVTRAFGDRVKSWNTINEPFCASFLSYKYGRHAPGVEDTSKALIAAHHLLLAHGSAMSVIRANVKEAKAGIALNEGPVYPVTRSLQNWKPHALAMASSIGGSLIQCLVDIILRTCCAIISRQVRSRPWNRTSSTRVTWRKLQCLRIFSR